MKKLLFLVILTLISCGGGYGDETYASSSSIQNSGKIYFEDNHCKCPQAQVGDIDIINGKTYVAVNNSTIKDEIAAGNYNLCTTLVTDMSGSGDSLTNFFNDNSFNSDISFWDVSNVTNMDGIFFQANIFNQNISAWDVSNVTNMGSMFKNASSFNQNISNWDTSKVTKMLGLFSEATAFNQNIEDWNTSNVTSMEGMFFEASSFNQNLSSWCVTNLSSEPQDFSTNSALLQENKPVWGTCPQN